MECTAAFVFWGVHTTICFGDELFIKLRCNLTAQNEKDQLYESGKNAENLCSACARL